MKSLAALLWLALAAAFAPPAYAQVPAPAFAPNVTEPTRQPRAAPQPSRQPAERAVHHRGDSPAVAAAIAEGFWPWRRAGVDPWGGTAAEALAASGWPAHVQQALLAEMARNPNGWEISLFLGQRLAFMSYGGKRGTQKRVQPNVVVAFSGSERAKLWQVSMPDGVYNFVHPYVCGNYGGWKGPGQPPPPDQQWPGRRPTTECPPGSINAGWGCC